MKAVKSERFYTANNLPRIGILLLASGSSVRMGEPKLLLPWEGKTIVEKALSAGAAFPSLEKLMVYPPSLPALKELGETYAWSIVENRDPSRGQASSLVEGLLCWEKLGILEKLQGILCMVGDQPFVSPVVIEGLVASFDEYKVVIPKYGMKPGNPVLFGSRWFPELRELQGDEGGRQVIRRIADEDKIYVPFPEFMGRDMDTLEDYKELLSFAMKNR